MPNIPEKKVKVSKKAAAKAADASAPKPHTGRSLVIVESPTKAKTIGKFLGRDFKVLSSYGHVRDLPKSKIGVDTEHDFAPVYEIPEKAKKHVAEIREAAANADMVYFASDEDREGEAISWHLLALLDLEPERVRRITFHEITEEAITHALENPRQLDQNLVDAQQARRVLDRLVGYKLSPFLWSKITFGLSAGRVQSVVVRLIVEREREIQKFIPQEYWSIEALLAEKKGTVFPSRLVKKDGDTLDKFGLSTGAMADEITAHLKGAAWTVQSVERKTQRRSPSAPFTTSTLQQEANNRLGFSAKQTMMIAQKLYEGMDLGAAGHTGLITYMRTDSVNLSEKFVGDARAWLAKNAADGLPTEKRAYKTKAKGAQEAHEAIRPTNVFATPDSVALYLDERQLRLYTLIWQRAVASQMNDAEMMGLSVNIEATRTGTPAYGFRATGSTIVKKGFLAVYETDTKETILPELTEGDTLAAQSVTPKQHFTEPPPRYNEGSIVKTLEELGIGRPSTYAPTISTVVGRGYVEMDGRRLKPTDLGFLITDLLVKHFPHIVDYGFTAAVEEDFDAIAEGKKKWVPMIRDFYGPFEKNLVAKNKEVKKTDFYEASDEICEKCGRPMMLKYGRLGRFMACTGYTDKKNPCRNTKPVPGSAEALAAAAAPAPTDEKCDCPGKPETKCDHKGTCGQPMVVKQSRYGAFLGCSDYPKCKHKKAILKLTGVKCPKCKTGEIVEKKTIRGGRIFYGCSNYAKDKVTGMTTGCDFVLQAKPTGQECPKCGSLVVYGKQDTVRCSNKECDYTAAAPTPPAAADAAETVPEETPEE